MKLTFFTFIGIIVLIMSAQDAQTGSIDSGAGFNNNMDPTLAVPGTVSTANGTRHSRVKTYYVSDDKTDFAHALLNCVKNFGGTLATVLNKVEFDQLHAAVGLLGNFWIGGHYLDGRWEWATTHQPIQSSQLIWYADYCKKADPTIYPYLMFKTDITAVGFCGSVIINDLRYICEV